MRLRLLLAAAAIAAALPAAPANAATASAATFRGPLNSICDANTCTFSGTSTECDDLGAACTAVLFAVTTRVNVENRTTRCEGSGTLRFTSKGRTTVVPIFLVTGPSVTVGAFSGARTNGTNDTVHTDGSLKITQCGSTIVAPEEFEGRLAGAF